MADSSVAHEAFWDLELLQRFDVAPQVAVANSRRRGDFYGVESLGHSALHRCVNLLLFVPLFFGLLGRFDEVKEQFLTGHRPLTFT